MSASDTSISIALSPSRWHLLIADAHDAIERNDLATALVRFAKLRAEFPDVLEGYEGACDVLRQMDRFEDAEALAEEAMRVLPSAPELMHQHALIAFDRADHNEAARRWGEMCEFFPDSPVAHRFAMLSLRLAERVEEAERIAPVALARFEDDPAIWTEYVLLALHREDWGQTAARAEMMREIFPGSADGYRFGVVALREAGDLDGAERLGEAGLAVAADSPSVHHEHAMTAFSAGDLVTAAHRWRAMRDAFPDVPAGYLFGIIALRQAGKADEADQVAAIAMERFPDSPQFSRDRAVAAIDAGKWPDAIRLLEQMRSNWPDIDAGWHLGVLALREAGRFPDAEQLAIEGRKRFPGSVELAREQALTTLAGAGPADAAVRFREMRAMFPGEPVGWRMGIYAAREAGNTDDAERIAAASVERFPDDPEIWNEWAFTAFHRGDLDESSRRWDRMRARFPDHPRGYIGGVMTLRQSARFEEADRHIQIADDVARAGLRRFPGHEALWREYAFTALHSCDWPEAVRRWRAMRERFPENPDAYRFGAMALRNAGDADGAENLIREGLRRLGDHPDLWIEYGRSADYASDQDEASRRWTEVRRLFPEHKEGYVNGIVALRESGRLDDAEILQREYLSRFNTDRNVHLMMRFESIGDTCEFGLVQRHFGAEPLGLLRWSSIDVPHLVRALDRGFEGVGDPAQVSIHLEDETYMIADDATGFRVHSFINAAAMDREKFLEMSRRWLRYLKDKLLRDLSEGEKIFVYKPRHGVIPDAEVTAIHAGVRAHGPGWLLCLKLADEEHPDGLVELVADRLMIGYISQVSPTAYHLEIHFDSWLAICQSAVSLVDRDARA